MELNLHDDDHGNGSSGRQHTDPLAAMRNDFFGTPQEAGVNPGTDVNAHNHVHSNLNEDDADNYPGLPPTVVLTRTTAATATSDAEGSGRDSIRGVGMSAAQQYFSREPDARHSAEANPPLPSPYSSPQQEQQDQQGSAMRYSDSEDEDSPRDATRSPTVAATTAQGGDGSRHVGFTDLGVVKGAAEEERERLEHRPRARPLTADEEQAARLHAYDEVCGTSTWDFLRETAHAIVPDAVTTLVDTGADTIARNTDNFVPEGVRRAADAFGSAATTASHAIEAVPRLMVNIIPDALMSADTKKVLFGDFTNTLRSFYHTNVLSMPFVLNQAGLVGGILLLLAVSSTSEYATEAFFGAKNQLRDARKVVTYGDVPRLTWGDWYPSLNLFYGITHLIGFVAFSASNTRVLLAAMGLTGGGAMAVSLIVPSVISLPLVFIKRDVDQRPYAVISSFIVFVSVVCMFTYFPYSATTDIKLWANSASDYFVALGVTVYAFTGIGSCTPIERTMRPRRYVKCLRAAVSVSCAILLAFGLSGFLSYGSKTCSVITVSLQPGPMKTAVSALLFVASIAIIPQQTFPLCELCDRRLLGIRYVPRYWELKPNLLRIASLVVSALAAWVVPYYGLLLSISGALGCGTVGIVVPAAMDYMRRARWGLLEGRHLRWWEYLVVFGLGLYGCVVIIIGVTFGMYKMWITIQTNAVDTC